MSTSAIKDMRINRAEAVGLLVLVCCQAVTSGCSTPSRACDTADATICWLEKQQGPLGLLPSQQDTTANTCDNAKAAMAFLLAGDAPRAEHILDFFDKRLSVELKPNGENCDSTNPCGFFQSHDSATGSPSGPRWMGDNAWLLLAVTYYQEAKGAVRYADLSAGLAGLLLQWQQPDGHVASGWDVQDSAPMDFGTGAGHTEGNLDAFKALSRAGRVSEADRVKAWLYSHADDWSTTSLDLRSWRVLALGPSYGFALQDAEMVDDPVIHFRRTISVAGKQVTGFVPGSAMSDNVGPDATGSMAVAFELAGYSDRSAYYVGELEKLIIEPVGYPGTKALPYLALPDNGDHSWVQPNRGHVAAVTWFLFARQHFDPFGGTILSNQTTSDPLVRLEAEGCRNVACHDGDTWAWDKPQDSLPELTCAREDSRGSPSEGKAIHVGGDNKSGVDGSGRLTFKFNVVRAASNVTVTVQYADDVGGDGCRLLLDDATTPVLDTTTQQTHTPDGHEGWDAFQDSTTGTVGRLGAGVHSLTVEFTDAGTYGFAIDYIDFQGQVDPSP